MIVSRKAHRHTHLLLLSQNLFTVIWQRATQEERKPAAATTWAILFFPIIVVRYLNVHIQNTPDMGTHSSYQLGCLSITNG